MMDRGRILIFETHATSIDNEAGVASGWYDVDLSASGVRQAAELGNRHRDRQLTGVYCSDLRRSRRTAEIAFAGRGIPIVEDPRLRECDYGALTRSAASRIEQVRLDFVTGPFPGGESYGQVAGRVHEWLAEIRRGSVEHPVLVIGHRATFYAFEHLLNGIPLRDAIAAPWQWQPGWRYQLLPRGEPRARLVRALTTAGRAPQSSRITRSSRSRRAGSASTSMPTIFARENMKPNTTRGRPPGVIAIHPVGYIRSALRKPAEAPRQGSEGAPDAWLEVDSTLAQGLSGIAAGTEVIVITWLHRADRNVLEVHPRNDPEIPLAGVFATRSPDRPNPVGLHRVTVREIAGTRLRIGPIEAIDGTPVIDIKAVLGDGDDA